MEGAERDSNAARLLGAESLSTSASTVRHNRSPCANRRPIATKALKMLGATMDDIMVDKALRVDDERAEATTTAGPADPTEDAGAIVA